MSNTAQGPIVEDVSRDGTEDAGQKRLLLGLVVLAAVLVAGAAVYFLFLSGGESEEGLGPVPSAAGAPSAEEPKKSKKQKDSDKAPKVNNNFEVGRDPFEPLAAEAPIVTEEDTTATTGATTQPDTNNPGQASNGAADSAYTLTVLSTNPAKGTADIDIDGKTYSVATGDVFPSATQGPFKLVKVESGKVKVVFGSDIPVVLKKGNSVDFYTT